MNLLTCVDGRFGLVAESAQALGSWTKPFHVTSFIGTERAGKSTMASWLSDYSEFPSMSGNEGFTKAVWAATKPNDAGIWFLDFEGFGQDTKHNTSLFVIAVLASHSVVFNSPKQITPESLDKLQSAGELSHSLMVGQRPALVWLLRDYDLDGNDDQSGYLLRCMAQNPDIANHIRTLFPELACLRVPPPNGPVPKNAVPHHMQNAVKKIRAEIQRITCAKQATTGPEFVQFLAAVCDAVNNAGETLNVSTAWQARQEGEKRVQQLQRGMEIQQILHKELSNLSPSQWDQQVSTMFSGFERVTFELLFIQERSSVEEQWVAKTTKVKNKVEAKLKQCETLKQLSDLFRDIISRYKPREMAECALVQLLPDIAKRVADFDETLTEQLKLQQTEIELLRDRVTQLDATLAARVEQAKQAREDVLQRVAQQHAEELLMKEQELAQERERILRHIQDAKQQREDLAQLMMDVQDRQLRLEEETAQRQSWQERCESESQQVNQLKRKVEDQTEAYEQATKRHRAETNQQLLELRAGQDRLADQGSLLTEQLEHAKQENDLFARRITDLETSRNKYHEEVLSLRNELFLREPTLSTADAVSLKATVKTLQDQNKRLLEEHKKRLVHPRT